MNNKAVIKLIDGRTSLVADGTVTVPLCDTRADSYAGMQNYDTVIFLLKLNTGSAITGTFALFIEDTWDNGTTWDDIVSSNTFAFGAAGVTQRFVIQGRIATTITQGSAAAAETLAAGTVRSGPFGDRIRVREKISSASGTPTGVTYSLTMILCRSENN